MGICFIFFSFQWFLNEWMCNLFSPIAFVLRTYWAFEIKWSFQITEIKYMELLFFFFLEKMSQKKSRRKRLLSYTSARSTTRVCELRRNLEICSRYSSAKSRCWALGLKTEWVKMPSSSSLNQFPIEGSCIIYS